MRNYVLLLFAFSISSSSIFPTSILPEEPKVKSVVEIIKEYSEEYKVPYFLAYELAKFESKLCSQVKNPKTSATGCYQFIKSTWRDFCDGDVLDNDDNIRCAMKLIGAGGIQHWTADSYVRLKLWDLGMIKCRDYDKNKCSLIWN